MTPDRAELIAVQALAWLAANEELLPVFLNATGAGPDDLRGAARDPAFLGSVLDFVMFDDATVMAFCEAQGLKFTEPMAARQVLPGGAQVNWT
jgi:hypothetical protein